jgi:hypothetical protein
MLISREKSFTVLMATAECVVYYWIAAGSAYNSSTLARRQLRVRQTLGSLVAREAVAL